MLNIIARGYNDLFTCRGQDPNNDSYTLCFAGSVPFERMISDLALSYKLINSKPESPVLVTGALLVNKQGGLPSLVFGDYPVINSIGHKNNCLYGAHHILLDPTCSSRLWGGVYCPMVEDMPVKKGDVIINNQSICSAFSGDNALDLPGTGLFVEKDLQISIYKYF